MEKFKSTNKKSSGKHNNNKNKNHGHQKEKGMVSSSRTMNGTSNTTNGKPFGIVSEDTHLGRSPSPAVRSKNNNQNSKNIILSATTDKNKEEKSANVDDNKKNNPKDKNKSDSSGNNQKQQQAQKIIFAKSLFDRLPRASALPEGFFKKHQLLGTGAFAQTYLCEWVSEAEEQAREQKIQEQIKNNIQNSSSESALSRNNRNSSPGAMKLQLSPRHTSQRARSGGIGDRSSRAFSEVFNSTHNRQSHHHNNHDSVPAKTPNSAYVSTPQSNFHINNNNNNNNNNQLPAFPKEDQQQQHTGDATTVNTANAAVANDNANNDSNGKDNKNKNNNKPSSSSAAANNFTALQLSSPYGQVSHLSSTKPFVTSILDGTQIPRDRAFVCKFEANTSVSKRLECMGQAQNPNIAEEHILANCAHPNIVAFADFFQDSDGNSVLVMEYVDGGDLKHELDRRSERVVAATGAVVPAKHFSERSIMFLFVQMVMAIEYLHRHNILHRDLKTPNILLSKKWLVKISDFGLAKQFDTDVDLDVSVSNVGTPYYLSPAQWRRRPYSEKADVWCLGVILYELITLQKPFDGETVKDLARAVCVDPPVPFNRAATVSEELKDLCLKMLAKTEEARPSAKEVLRLPIMQSAMQDFLEKFGIATATSTSSVDVSWNRVLAEQRKLVLRHRHLSSTKSRRSQSRERSSKRHSAYATSLHSRSSASRESRNDSDDEEEDSDSDEITTSSDDDDHDHDARSERDENVGINTN
jgi:serine/threonine protein kinase